jgi:hypothetical protein
MRPRIPHRYAAFLRPLKGAASGGFLVKREDKPFEASRQWLLEARRVHFLGFAYHPENLERLKFGTGTQRKGQITGTCVGLSDARIHDLETSGAEFGIPTLFPKGKVGIDGYFSELIEG